MMGIDIGATTIAGGLVTDAGDVLEVVQAPTHRNGPGTAAETLLDVGDDLHRRTTERGVTLAGIGVGVPGAVDPEKGVMSKPRRMLDDALRECGSKTRAAERLGLSRQSLQQMLRRRQP